MSNILYDVRDMLMRELNDTFSYNGKMTAEKLDIIDKITHSIKSIDTVCAMESSGYGNSGNSYGNHMMPYYNSYNNGYSNGNGYGNSYTNYSIPNVHYSREDAKTNMLRRLDEMMKEAQTDKEREAIRMCIDKIGS